MVWFISKLNWTNMFLVKNMMKPDVHNTFCILFWVEDLFYSWSDWKYCPTGYTQWSIMTKWSHVLRHFCQFIENEKLKPLIYKSFQTLNLSLCRSPAGCNLQFWVFVSKALKVLHTWSGRVFPHSTWKIFSSAVRIDGNVTQSVQKVKGASFSLYVESLCIALFFLAFFMSPPHCVAVDWCWRFKIIVEICWLKATVIVCVRTVLVKNTFYFNGLS